MDGGYDAGYTACPCFWGGEPGSLVKKLAMLIGKLSNLSVIDIGCGEGKNSIFFAREGAKVQAIDISEAALKNAKLAWKDFNIVNWQCQDVMKIPAQGENYDVVIAYGLLHCLANEEEISNMIKKMHAMTAVGGYNILCTFNDRHQDLSAHPEFSPTLCSHEFYLDMYRDWELKYCTDEDLHETHPHNNIPHSHSMTRIIAKKIITNELPT